MTVPLSAAAINAIVIPPPSAFPTPANEGTYAKTNLSKYNAQHTNEVIPDRLSLNAGWTWACRIATSNVSNISNIPWAATDVFHATQWLHRIGAVVKLTKEVSVYAMESTTFTPPPGSGSILENGQLPPPQAGKDRELGMKTALMGGRISTNFAWFHMTTTNITFTGGIFPNGLAYVVPVGNTVQEGVDGDFDLTVLPGWQLITSWYAGHDRDQNNNPVSGSYDNSWSFFNRYDFQPNTPLRGLAIGAGLVHRAEGWISTASLNGSNAFLTPQQLASGEIKMHPGTLLNAFLAYRLARHWTFHVTVDNILNQDFPIGAQTIYFIDPSPPTTYSFQVDYKF